MTISKKLLIAALVTLGFQLNTAAYFSASSFKKEIKSILVFMDVLRSEKNDAAEKLVISLEKEFTKQEARYEWTRYTLDEIELINIAKIIEQNMAMDNKIAEISAIFKQRDIAKELHLKEETKRRYKEIMHTILGLGAIAITLGSADYIHHLLMQ